MFKLKVLHLTHMLAQREKPTTFWRERMEMGFRGEMLAAISCVIKLSWRPTNIEGSATFAHPSISWNRSAGPELP